MVAPSVSRCLRTLIQKHKIPGEARQTWFCMFYLPGTTSDVKLVKLHKSQGVWAVCYTGRAGGLTIFACFRRSPHGPIHFPSECQEIRGATLSAAVAVVD